MKLTYSTTVKTLVLMLSFTLHFCKLQAQSNKTAVSSLVESREFVFHAQTALPVSGSIRQLTSDYELKVSPGSIVSHLPFFGRAYSLPYNPTDGGFNFTSVQFEYNHILTKKSGWNISIKPKDVADLREFSLSVSDNGYCTLQVISSNRQSISFTGYIDAVK